MKGKVLRLIRLYQRTLSQATPPSCRFIPTCSQYACEAIEKFGLLKGSGLTVFRLIRCNPFNSGGYDPVPQEFSGKRKSCDILQ